MIFQMKNNFKNTLKNKNKHNINFNSLMLFDNGVQGVLQK